MIELTDITLLEASGNYNNTVDIMSNDTPGNDWMLESDCYVCLGVNSTKFTLHFWSNGDVYIWEAPSRSVGMDDQDIEVMAIWCRENGWKALKINDRFLRTPQETEYWSRAYLKGFIQSDFLKKEEEAEMHRMQSGLELEGNE